MRLLKIRPHPTAVFCFNDLMAIGAIKKIKDHHLGVPEDISIVGFDNIPYSTYISPALTTFNQPKYKMGQEAAEMLLHVLATPSRPKPEFHNAKKYLGKIIDQGIRSSALHKDNGLNSTKSRLLISPDFSQSQYMTVTPEIAGWEHLTFGAVKLERGQEWVFNTLENELAVAILGGSGDVITNSETYLHVGSRKDVFHGLPTAHIFLA